MASCGTRMSCLRTIGDDGLDNFSIASHNRSIRQTAPENAGKQRGSRDALSLTDPSSERNTADSDGTATRTVKLGTHLF